MAWTTLAEFIAADPSIVVPYDCSPLTLTGGDGNDTRKGGA